MKDDGNSLYHFRSSSVSLNLFQNKKLESKSQKSTYSIVLISEHHLEANGAFWPLVLPIFIRISLFCSVKHLINYKILGYKVERGGIFC